MLYTAIVLFALAAIFGIVIIKNWILSTNTSRAVVYVHGVFAAAALGLLAYYFYKNPGMNVKTSLILFAIGAIVGFYMFFRDLKGKFSPTWLGIVHGLVGVVAFVLLLLLVI